MKELFLVRAGGGVILVLAESAEKALKMMKEPALVETGMLDAAIQAQVSDAEHADLDPDALLMLRMMGFRTVTEALVVAATSSVEAFKDESLKLFCTEGQQYVIAAKDRADALDIIAGVGAATGGSYSHPDPKAFADELAAQLAEQETPRSEFERPPKVISRKVLEWYNSLPPPELPVMPQPPYIM